jgi:hypothetical protein
VQVDVRSKHSCKCCFLTKNMGSCSCVRTSFLFHVVSLLGCTSAHCAPFRILDCGTLWFLILMQCHSILYRWSLNNSVVLRSIVGNAA